MKNKWLEVISKFPLFRGILGSELQNILTCLNIKTIEYKKGECIAIAGEKFLGIGMVLNGEVAVIKENYIGDRNILGIFKKYDMFGEIAAFTSGKVWPATVLAQTDATIMFIHPEKILGTCEKVCSSHKALISNMLGIISKKALILNKKIEYLSIKSIKGKLAKYLLEEHQNAGSLSFTLPLNREELADFLNVSRPSMSRELCKMRDSGIIEFYKNSINIMELEELKNMIE